MFPDPIQKLINHFSSLPGIGPKTAARLVFDLLKKDNITLKNFGDSLTNLKEGLNICATCFNYSISDPCAICAAGNRDQSIICVVAESKDIEVIEKTGEFKGVYHVLKGTLNPLENIHPANLKINELEQRIIKKQPQINEVLLALNPDIAGESTILYLSKLLKRYPIKTTRLARGLPSGADLEYSDPSTLSSALKGRTNL